MQMKLLGIILANMGQRFVSSVDGGLKGFS